MPPKVHVRRYVRAFPFGAKARSLYESEGDKPKFFKTDDSSKRSSKKMVVDTDVSPSKPATKVHHIAVPRPPQPPDQAPTYENVKEAAQKAAADAEAEAKDKQAEVKDLETALGEKRRKLGLFSRGGPDERRQRAEIRLIESQVRQSKRSLGGLRQEVRRQKEEVRLAGHMAKQAGIQAGIQKEDLKRARLETRVVSLKRKEQVREQKERLRLQNIRLSAAREKTRASNRAARKKRGGWF